MPSAYQKRDLRLLFCDCTVPVHTPRSTREAPRDLAWTGGADKHPASRRRIVEVAARVLPVGGGSNIVNAHVFTAERRERLRHIVCWLWPWTSKLRASADQNAASRPTDEAAPKGALVVRSRREERPPRREEAMSGERRDHQTCVKNIGAHAQNAARFASRMLSILSMRSHMPRCFSSISSHARGSHRSCADFARAVRGAERRWSIERMPEAEREVSGRRLQKERTSAMLYSERQHARSARPWQFGRRFRKILRWKGMQFCLCTHRRSPWRQAAAKPWV